MFSPETLTWPWNYLDQVTWSFDFEQNCLCYETSDLTENQLNLSDRTRLLAFKCGETRLKIILEHISFCGILAPNIFNLKMNYSPIMNNRVDLYKMDSSVFAYVSKFI